MQKHKLQRIASNELMEKIYDSLAIVAIALFFAVILAAIGLWIAIQTQIPLKERPPLPFF